MSRHRAGVGRLFVRPPQLANVEVDCDHRGFLTRKKVYGAILAEIRRGETEAPVVRGKLAGMQGGRPEGEVAGGTGAPASSDVA